MFKWILAVVWLAIMAAGIGLGALCWALYRPIPGRPEWSEWGFNEGGAAGQEGGQS